MIDGRIASNIIGFMERAPLKAGLEVPAYNEARAKLDEIVAAEEKAKELAAKRLEEEKKKAAAKKKPRRKGTEADDNES